ncbi:hypothetical protein ACHABQ_03070 [Nesterenkonia aurantiaca]|uniref:hypothetical protein n=1 Tax=Nesterenkonia aurantiaca TaxID=1436010 RepID=UPI003EE5112D
MNGNPHYAPHLLDHADTDDGRAVASSALALAYEQRTANLIAAFVALENADDDPTFLAVHELDGQNLARDIRTRLGLETRL